MDCIFPVKMAAAEAIQSFCDLIKLGLQEYAFVEDTIIDKQINNFVIFIDMCLDIKNFYLCAPLNMNT